MFKSVSSSHSGSFFNSIGMEFMLFPAGKFWKKSKTGGFDQAVFVSAPFYLGKYQVTQEQWKMVMGNNPAVFQGRNKPVENVSWDDAQKFIARLNAKEGVKTYRLPLEEEWEFAARGGTDTQFFFMQDPKTRQEAEASLTAFAWFNKNSGRRTHSVGGKAPNPYGLHDLYGNVWEWTQNRCDDVPEEERAALSDLGDAPLRVIRGGAWNSFAGYCRSDYRGCHAQDQRSDNTGLRLACSPGR
jgi:formylglycine-generating enzyme required for sulfatase activity